MLASSIRIDRLLEPDIRRVVVGDDRARGLRPHFGRDRLGCLLLVPAVIHRLRLSADEARMRIAERAAAFESIHRRTVHIYSTTRKRVPAR